jgi:hypothetical protein
MSEVDDQIQLAKQQVMVEKCKECEAKKDKAITNGSINKKG